MSRLLAKNKADALGSFLRVDEAERVVDAGKNALVDTIEMDNRIKAYVEAMRKESDAKAWREHLAIIDKDSKIVNAKLIEREQASRKNKCVFIHSQKLQKTQMAELSKYYKITRFSKDLHMGKRLEELDFHALCVPINKRIGRAFFSTVVAEINNNDNIDVILMKGKKMYDMDIEDAKKKFNIKGNMYIKQKLPKHTHSKEEYDFQLFASDIESFTSSCMPILKVLMK